MAIWSWCLNDKPSLQDLLEVQKHFGLPSPALVEKDWYVVKALAALVAVDAAPFRLVFGGGTALSRAHRLIRRMSEDIDLKIISDTTVTRPALRHLRDFITKALLQAGFLFDPENPRHRESCKESRYTLYRLAYAPITAGGNLAARDSNRDGRLAVTATDRKSTRLNSSHLGISYAVFCLKK